MQLPSYGPSVLIAGTSGGGKSTLATGLLEQLVARGYQVCIIDSEGDYEAFAGAIVLGNAQQPPNGTEVLDLLSQPDQNLVINLLGVNLEERPSFFAGLLPSLLEMRTRTGRPHWLVVDEAHHMLPDSWNPAAITLPQTLHNLLLITVHPDHIAVPVLSLVDMVIAVGQSPDQTIASLGQQVSLVSPTPLPDHSESGEVLAWFCHTDEPPFRFQVEPPPTERQRHQRKYAEGELEKDSSFYFRGATAQLNLRAQNLILFTQLAEGVDDETWLYHLRQQDYSQWFRDSIKDKELAAVAADIETTPDLSAAESRDRIKTAINRRYTLPD